MGPFPDLLRAPGPFSHQRLEGTIEPPLPWQAMWSLSTMLSGQEATRKGRWSFVSNRLLALGICSLLGAEVSCLVPQKLSSFFPVAHWPLVLLVSSPFGVEGQYWRKDNKNRLEPLFFKNVYSA